MIGLLIDFWRWADISPEKYAETGLDILSDKAEFYYPNFDKLLEYAEIAICKDEISDEEIEDVLTIMALDNETENVLYLSETKMSSKNLKRFIEAGVRHVQPNTRWQIAELIFRRKPENYDKYLLELSLDPHSYVKKRANNLLKYLLDD